MYDVILVLTAVTIVQIFVIVALLNSVVKYKPRYKLQKVRVFSFNKKKINWDYIDSLDGVSFEDLCCDLLNKLGYKNIMRTPVTGDYGIDIICEKNKVKYGIQCKCYTNTVGVSAIQEAYAGSAYYKCDVAVVLTNNYFTDSAQELARVVGVSLWSRHYMSKALQQVTKQLRREKRK